MKKHEEPWYTARCVFRHTGGPRKPKHRHLYEERIVLLRARSENEAIRQAEREARIYARSLAGTEYLGFIEVFHLFDSVVQSGSEVFSLMRSSNLAPGRFVSRFYDDGSEHRRKWKSQPGPKDGLQRTAHDGKGRRR